MREKILYFDCSAGISGDMTLGALLDLGADKKVFLAELEKLHLEGYEIAFETTQRNAITATHVNVILTGQEQAHDHTHEHDHEHTHDHSHDHGHGHFHRSFRDIRQMIQNSELSKEVKDLSLRIFTRVARAEAKVHHRDMEEVQFHEVGAVDSIVDIVGSAILITMLKPDRICASVVQDGHGFVHCQHGMLSVPVPAVCEIFAESDVLIRQIDVDTELVTPTGAAIISELADSFGTMPVMTIDKMGWGAGTKILKIPNLLKVTLGYQETVSDNYTEQDEIMVLETNLDDCTGEMMGLTMELLLAAGARDVNYTPIYMKKNRPACKLEVLCKEEKVSALEEVIFHQTTAIGLRKRKEVRRILPRKKETVMTPYGEVELKICTSAGENYIYPEYDSIRGLVLETGRSYQEIYQKAVEEAWKKKSND